MSVLYIMRHGDAVSRAPTDSERPLSDRGRQEAESMIQHLLERPPERVLVSPYLRAQQTARIVLEGLNSHGHLPVVETIPYITPDDSPTAAVGKLADFTDDTLLMVSHNPFVSILVGLLTEGHMQGGIPMATASIARITGSEIGLGTGDLDWYKTP